MRRSTRSGETERTEAAEAGRLPLLTKRQLLPLVRARLAGSIYDDSGSERQRFAVYTLSDPRAIRDARYVGQTESPARRFLQHINTARLWLPDAVPWWFKSPALRPLYEWIRELHEEEYRLPVMIVHAWAPTLADARALERATIYELLRANRLLFNVECSRLGRKIPLL
jgi:hypothetical protein